MVENLVMGIKKLKFVAIFIFYEANKGVIVVAKNSNMTLTSKHISVKYYWFRKNVGKYFSIWRI